MWLHLMTLPALEIVRVFLWSFFVIVSLGWVTVEVLAPDIPWSATKVGGLVISGYVAAPVLALGLGYLDCLALYAPMCVIALACGSFLSWLKRVVRTRGERTPTGSPHSSLLTSPGWIVGAVSALSVVAVSPLMNQWQPSSAQSWVSYAYIDAYQGVSYVQAFMREIPMADWPSLAEAPPILVP